MKHNNKYNFRFLQSAKQNPEFTKMESKNLWEAAEPKAPRGWSNVI